MRSALVLFAFALAVVLGYLTPAQASNQQQRQVQKQVSKQSNRQGFAARLRNRGNGHNNAQQLNGVHRQQQNFNGHGHHNAGTLQFRAVERQRVVFVPVERFEADHCDHRNDAGVLQLNGGSRCSALYGHRN